MDVDKARYVLRYYGQLMTTPERLAHRHLMGTAKATRGRTDSAAQSEVANSSHPLRELLSNDSQVLRLASEGIDVFMVRTAQRILDKHSVMKMRGNGFWNREKCFRMSVVPAVGV
jgi:hypothetical protein